MLNTESKDPLDELLERATQVPFARDAIEQLAASAPASLLRRAFESALDLGGLDAARNLGFALAAAKQTLPYAPLSRLAFETGAFVVLMPLIAAVEGDPVQLVLDGLESSHLTYERRAIVLFCTFELAGRKAPPRLLSALRAVARESLPPQVGLFIGVAAQLSGDADLIHLARRYEVPLEAEKLQEMANEFAGRFLSGPLCTVPEKAAPRGGDHTVVRTLPRIGRNDPCPCGSGRKYKKCCAEKAERAGAELPLVEQFEQLGDEHRQVRNQLFDMLHPAELARVNIARLSTRQIIDGMRRLAEIRRWEDADRFADVLETRTDVPGGIDQAPGYRWEIGMEAFEAGAFDVAQDQFERSSPSEEDRKEIEIDLALAHHAPGALERLEERVVAILRARNAAGLVGLAHTLVKTHPAVGLLVARAALDPDRDLDSEMLLRSIDEVRDRLLLDPEEPWWQIYGLWIDDHQEKLHRAYEFETDAREREALNREIDELRRKLRGAGEQAQTLAAELESGRRQLERLAREREELSMIVATSGTGEARERMNELEAERLRLREKITVLEGQISHGNEQRVEMRRQMKVLAAQRGQEAVATPVADAAADADLDSGVPSPRFVLVPSYAPGAARSLASLPRHIAVQALRATSSLAAGDEHAWKGVKRMKSTEDVYSARTDRAHRLLFRFGNGELQVLDIVDRKDLDAAVARYA